MKNVEDIYPLSSTQAGMLYHCVAAPDDRMYIEQYLAQLEGALDLPRFQQAWDAVLVRHPALRAAFVWEGLKEPMQIVRREVQLPCALLDWTSRPAQEHEASFTELLRLDRAKGFVLTQAPVMRLAIVRLAADRHALLWTFHHLILDGWSCALVQREVGDSYAAAPRGRSVSVAPARPHADYVRWQREQDLARAERFWRGALSGVQPTPLRFEEPVETVDPAAPEDTAEVTCELTAEKTATIVQAARAQGLALNTVCQAAWALVLARYAAIDDVVFGAIVSGRPPQLEGSDRMVGLFINTLCVRVTVPPRARAGAWLAQLQQQAAEAREYAYTPLADAQRWSGARHETLFESVCVYQNYPRGGADSGSGSGSETAASSGAPLRVTPLRTVEKTNYPLTLVITPGERLHLMFVVQTRRFAVDAMSRVLEQVAATISTLLADPARELRDIPLPVSIASARAHAHAALDRDDRIAVHESFERQVAATPGAIAVLCGDQTLTYDALNRRANRLARHLRAQGVEAETIVGIEVERSLDLVVALLAVLKAGGAYAPLDPRAPAERKAAMRRDANVRLVLTRPALDAAGDVDEANLAMPATPESLAYVIFTSGSTGRPKGVMIPHGALANHMRWMQRALPLTSADRVLQKTPIGFDASVWEFYAPLLAGATLVVASPGAHQDPALLIETIVRHEISILQVVPSMLRLLVDTDRFRACRSLRRVFVGGEALTTELQTRFFETSQAELVNLYGPTEVTIDSIVWPCQRGEARTRVAIGRPVDHTTAYALDRRLNPAPIGELWLGGAQIARGYCGRPDLTAERFLPDPFGDAPGARLYRTGDRGRCRSDGVWEFLGRVDHQIKLHGHRIELGEIEAALRAQPGVRDAVAQLREDNPGQPQLVGYVQAAAEVDAAVDIGGMPLALQTILPDYMVPSIIVALATWPLTANGKIDRAALPAPGSSRRASTTYVPARDAVELQLVQLWEQLLPGRPIGVRDQFFEIGGHSILVLQLVAHIERTFNLRLALADLVQGTTIERIAGMIRENRGGIEQRLVRLQAGSDDGPPLYAIVPAGGTLACYGPLAELMGVERPFYALQPRGSQQEAALAPTIELMAQADLQELRRHQPSGPYSLIGWSMGGLVAYAIACLLHDAGETVALLALLDTAVPDPRQLPRDATTVLVETAAQHLGVDLDALPACDPADRFDHVLRLAREQGGLVDEVDARWVRWLGDGFRASVAATERYVPPPYNGSMVLIRAEAHHASGDETRGWGGLVRGGVDVRWVPGAHHNIVHQPHVAAVADALRRASADHEHRRGTDRGYPSLVSQR
jgi:amino acid adenylation domain-containing protein